MITFKQKGDFSKLTKFLEKAKEAVKLGDLDKYGRMGVEALSNATPRDTGKTADSWYYEIIQNDGSVELRFLNSNVVADWCNIAIILQYGHATGNGGWVEGRDYINPAIRPIFDQITEEAWKEVTK